jgi:hypothetical protein
MSSGSGPSIGLPQYLLVLLMVAFIMLITGNISGFLILVLLIAMGTYCLTLL